MVFHLINRRIIRKITTHPHRTIIIAPATVRMSLQQKWLYILGMFIIPHLYPLYIIHNLPYYKGEIPNSQEIPPEVSPEESIVEQKINEDPKEEGETKGKKGKKKAIIKMFK